VKVRVPSRLTLLTVALLVLLPMLAVLQYQWAGQLSDAERERMQRNMQNAAAQFSDAFDHEIGRAFIALQVDGSIVRDQAWDRYAERYTAWFTTAAYPSIVANVYLIDGDGERLRLRHWNAAQRTFEAGEWEGPLAPSRSQFEQDLAAYRSGDRLQRRERPAFHEDESLLIAPVINVQLGPRTALAHAPLVGVFGYTVVQLNMPFIRERVLPQLAERHFTHTGDAAYRAAIVQAADAKQVVYRSSPDSPTDPSHADATDTFFNSHGDPLMFLARGAIRQGQALRDSSGALPPPDRDTHNVVVSVIREKRDVGGAIRTQFLGGPTGRWRLLLQHERGSLEAAVASVRQRNLLVSFGILLLMGVSIGLLAISSRRAQRLGRQQIEFVAGVSHELRTPVAVIRSAAENLSHGVVGDPARVRRYGDAIQIEARRLGEMVERVLQFAGIESGRTAARSAVSITPTVEAAIDATLATDAGVTIERHVAADVPLVLGDADMLRSAVQNLLVNAAKYGGPDRWIGVQVHAAGSARAREVRIRVEDRGRGITPADLPHIFEPFYRGADAVARQIQGSGLGLALVRRIVEAHGGRVTVESREDEGTTFTIHLPVMRLKPQGADVRAGIGDLSANDEAVAR
jgi:signal transduction histidine kinase